MEKLGQGKHQRPQWSDDVVARLKGPDMRGLTNREAAAKLSEEFMHPYHRDHVQQQRAKHGLEAPKAGNGNALPNDAEDAINAYVEKGMTDKQIAEVVAKETGRPLTQTAVSKWRLRRGITKAPPKPTNKVPTAKPTPKE